MKHRFALVAAIAAIASFGAVGSASAAGSLCSSLQVTVNGEALVDDQRCNELP